MLVVASIGAFMSSTGIVHPHCRRPVGEDRRSRTRLMMPLSVAALISGLLTLIATPPNLVISALTSRGLDALGFFELTPIGMAVLAIAIIYMVTAGRKAPRPARTKVRPGWRLRRRVSGQLRTD